MCFKTVYSVFQIIFHKNPMSLRICVGVNCLHFTDKKTEINFLEWLLKLPDVVADRKQILIWYILGTSLVVQWLRLRASTAGGTSSIPAQGAKTEKKKRMMV